MRKSAEAHMGRVDGINGEIKGIEDRIVELEKELNVTSVELSGKDKHYVLVEQFVRQHESHLKSRREKLEATQKELTKAKKDQEEWNNEAEANEERAEQYNDKAKKLGEDARALEEEYKGVEYLEETPSEAPGPVDDLRDRYRQLKANYEEKVGEEGLLQLCRLAENQAREERGKFKDKLTETINEQMVSLALNELFDPSEADVKRDEAVQENLKTRGAHGRQTQVEEIAKRELEERGKECEQLGGVADISPEELPPGHIQADAEAKKADEEAKKMDREAENYKLQSQNAEQRKTSLENTRKGLEKDKERLESIEESYREYLSPAEKIDRMGWVSPKDDEDVANHVRDLAKAFKELKTQCDQLDEKRNQIVKKVREWASEPRFDALQSKIARQIWNTEPQELETQADEMCKQLMLRVSIIDSQLTEMEKHRDLLINEALAAAEEGLGLVKSAANSSRLPDHVPGLGGTHFLRIKTDEPAEAGERKGRIGELIDELVDEGEMPSGISLVQRAVRRLARQIRVKVLNPDPDLDRKAVDITEMSRFSGGEQLTGAILLYCTLAQLRARNRGLSRKPSTVLLLDNPIGRVSRVRFLDLQREVARAMGVQLIYTTAVNDLEALRSLPNVIRMRNQRFDLNSGFRMVEHETEPASVDMARIVRHEDEAIVKNVQSNSDETEEDTDADST
ncbi:MAG: hypothetical protein JRI71_16755 [Deltaproteobacteria bacterium]|nr:hypothetical protein [Deltaproteobacteria bacterium]